MKTRSCLFPLLWLSLFAQHGLAQIPRPEHPKPQFRRDTWLNLNGEWDFAFDFGRSGVERKWYEDYSSYDRKIVVPFCPESKLSGIEYKDFMPAVWYHRSFEIPQDWKGKRVFLHFGAVDYGCQAWINGQLVGRHYGGSLSFHFEITHALSDGVNDLAVHASDDIRSMEQPAGKQSQTFYNQGCCKYTRVTGIWQTVWLEARPQQYVERVTVVADPDNERFIITPEIVNAGPLTSFRVLLFDDRGNEIGRDETVAVSGLPSEIRLEEIRAWSPEDPYLYDLIYQLVDQGNVIDEVKGYAGMREVRVVGNKIYLNDEPIFLRFVLDQGFYPDGVWTAPSDQALKNDIELSMSVGFNGARLHEKVFEERFHYWADRLGYLTWGEFPDWGADFSKPQALVNIKSEWMEEIQRDRNHPSIIAWTPLNETAGRARKNPRIHERFLSELYDLTKALDPTRPVNDASGYVHIKTDLFTIHDYDQSPAALRSRYEALNPKTPETAWIGDPHQAPELGTVYRGEPYIVDEYGGTSWTPDYAEEAPRGGRRDEWGYGKSAAEVIELIERLTLVLLNHPNIAGYTYTQLTDVEHEVNGIFSYDRQPKFDVEKLKSVFGAPAAMEREK